MIIDNRFNRNNVHLSLVLLVCITIVYGAAEDCSWTGCQPAATGCGDSNRTEKAREACDDGYKYRCCAATADGSSEEILADQCWWSECGPKDATDRGCPSHSVLQSQTRSCARGDGDQYLCCMKKSALLDYYDGFKTADRHEDVVAGYVHGGHGRQRAAAGEHRAYAGSRENATGRASENGGGTRARSRLCDGGRRVVGYYTSWNPNAMSAGMMEKLTHVIYAFLIPQADGKVDFDTPASLDRLRRLMELRKSHPHVKIMMAVGGGASSQQFGSIASSAGLRKTFVDSIVRLTNDNGLDGVDLDWEFPVVSSAVRGTPEDKANYVLVMKELREALNAHAAATGRSDPYLISFAGSAGQWALDPGFDLPGLLQYADFANAMAYDYFGVWGGSRWSAYTGPPAPLYPGTPSGFPEDFSHSNVQWTVGYYIEKIGSPGKINVGVPFYGWYWKNVGGPINAADPMWRKAQMVDGLYQGGATQWRSIQQDHLSDARFKQMFHEQCKTPYAWNEETKVFLGYEDHRSLGFKVKFAAEKNVGGLMIWAVDMDDDSLTLLNTLHQATAKLCGKSDSHVES